MSDYFCPLCGEKILNPHTIDDMDRGKKTMMNCPKKEKLVEVTVEPD